MQFAEQLRLDLFIFVRDKSYKMYLDVCFQFWARTFEGH